MDVVESSDLRSTKLSKVATLKKFLYDTFCHGPMTKPGSSNPKLKCAQLLPDQVAAEEEAEDEDKDGCPKDHNVDIKRKVLEPYIWHLETVVWEIGAHGYSRLREK